MSNCESQHKRFSVNSLQAAQLIEAVRYRWRFRARPEQIPPSGDWRTWIYLAGRGAGKTRSGAETIREWIESGRYQRIHLISPTAGDARDVLIEGESGILSISPPWFRPVYKPSKRCLVWPNGAVALLFSADKPDRLRGPQCDALWADELAAWRYIDEAWSMALLGLRLGRDPRAIVTTTPRPLPILKDLIKHPSTVLTHGTTYDNRENLAPGFIEQIISRYEGTRLGRQEIGAEILDDNPAALWRRSDIDATRWGLLDELPDMRRIVVAVDPSATAAGNETGIIVAGMAVNGSYFVLEDCSLNGTPDEWARAAVEAFHRHKADRIIYESNQGGDMVAHTLRTIDPRIPLRSVYASRGKVTRAEPIAALYEQKRVHHFGAFPILEDQMCDWEAGSPESPDRMDALVWALTELHTHRRGKITIR